MPIVKCQTFRSSSHHPTVQRRSEYLLRGGRELSVDTHNVADRDRWFSEMDNTRDCFGLRGDVRFREFVMSPDERDHATPEQVRELANRWVERNFQDVEVAVVLHNDSRSRLSDGRKGLVHAHVVVNATRLDGKKENYSKERVRELHNSAQDIAREMGLREIERYRKGERLRSSQRRQRTQAERQIEQSGRDSWKSSVRDMALQAKERSSSLEEFRTALRAADVELEVKKGRVYLVDRENPSRACRSDRLDERLSASELGRKFERPDRRNLSPEARTRHLAAKLKREIERGTQERPRVQAARAERDRACRERSERTNGPAREPMLAGRDIAEPTTHDVARSATRDIAEAAIREIASMSESRGEEGGARRSRGPRKHDDKSRPMESRDDLCSRDR